jgi:hypothetical protein
MKPQTHPFILLPAAFYEEAISRQRPDKSRMSRQHHPGAKPRRRSLSITIRLDAVHALQANLEPVVLLSRQAVSMEHWFRSISSRTVRLTVW